MRTQEMDRTDRIKIYNTLTLYPTHPDEIAKAIGCDAERCGAILRKLSREGKIKKVTRNIKVNVGLNRKGLRKVGYFCYFSDAEAERAKMLEGMKDYAVYPQKVRADADKKRVLDYVINKGDWCTTAEIADVVGITVERVRSYMLKMEREGKVDKELSLQKVPVVNKRNQSYMTKLMHKFKAKSEVASL